MMKRGTLIALGIFVVLLGVYFLTSESPPSEVSSPWTISAVEDASRIELERPTDSEDGSNITTERVVFTKGDDGWRMAEPVSSTLRESAVTTLKNAFADPIETDDLRLDAERAADYGVGQKEGVRLKVFTGDGETPAVDVLVGKRTTVEATGVERTYLRRPDESRIYRARTGLGTFVRTAVEDYRDKRIFDVETSAISSLRVERADGPTIVLERSDDTWRLASPEVPWSLDTDEIESVVKALASLSAKGFADDREPAALGLDAPRATVTVSTGDGQDVGTLELGRVESDEKTAWYAKRTDRPYHYTLSQYDGRKADVTLGDLRSKNPRPIEVSSVESVEFTGGDGLLVKRGDDGWMLDYPSTDASVDAGKIRGLVERVANLTVSGFPDITPSEAGLVGARDRIILRTDDARVVIRLGDSIEDGRYVGYQGDDEVFTVEGFVADKLTPSVDAVTGTDGGGARSAGPGREKRQKIEVLRGGENKLKNLKQLKQQLGK